MLLMVTGYGSVDTFLINSDQIKCIFPLYDSEESDFIVGSYVEMVSRDGKGNPESYEVVETVEAIEDMYYSLMLDGEWPGEHPVRGT